jgi:hypothetical protein
MIQVCIARQNNHKAMFGCPFAINSGRHDLTFIRESHVKPIDSAVCYFRQLPEDILVEKQQQSL